MKSRFFRHTSEHSSIFPLILIDEVVKSQIVGSPVIPAKAGIQSFPIAISSLDSGFHRSDDFLQEHLNLLLIFVKMFASYPQINI